MTPHKLGIKFFAAHDAIDPLELIPVFHGWIQRRELDDLLIDVADYSHVQAGPGIVLVGHEGNYGFDETGARRGLVYYAKQLGPGELAQRLAQVCRKALTACRLLEQAPETRGRLRFGGHALQVFANDRLTAPNTDETHATFEPALNALLARLYPAMACRVEREPDPSERFGVTVTVATDEVSIDTLLERLAA